MRSFTPVFCDLRLSLAWLRILGCMLALGLVGCGDDGADPALDSGTLSFFVTDSPSDDFDRIVVTLDEVTLIGGGPAVTLFEGRREIDLKQLEVVTDLFLMAEAVPARSYSKIRLGVESVLLVRDAFGDEPAEEVWVEPPANGKIDLNPRGPFEVRRGGHLVVEIDIDAERSIHLRPNGDGEYQFRPVVFVEIGERMRPSKPARFTGRLHERLGDDRFVLCPSNPFGRRTMQAGTRVPCIIVMTDALTGIFDFAGEPATLDDLAWPAHLPDGSGRGCLRAPSGIQLDPIGAIDPDDLDPVYVDRGGIPTECVEPAAARFYSGVHEIESKEVTPEQVVGVVEIVDIRPPTTQIIPLGYATAIGFFDGELMVREGAPSREPRMRAVTIEEGGPYAFETLSGLLFESEEAPSEDTPMLYFEPDPGQGAPVRPLLEALVQPGTRMFDREGRELDFDLEGVPRRVKIDAVLGIDPEWDTVAQPVASLTSDPDAFVYKLAYVAADVVADPGPWPAPEPRWLSGEVTGVDHGGLAIAVDDEDGGGWWSVREGVLVHFAYAGEDGAVSRPGDFDEIERGMRVEMLLEADGPPPVFAPTVSLIVSFVEPL